MKYQKIINFLDNTLNKPSNFATKNGFEINDDASGIYSTNSQTKFKTQCQSQVYVIIVIHIYL